MVSDIKIIPAYAYPQAVKALFTEYTDMLIAGDSSFQEYLAIQNYDEEIKHLEDKYGMPLREAVSGLLRREAGRLYRPAENR